MKDRIFHPYTPFSAVEEGLPNIVRGEGIYLFDEHGRRYVDIISSWWCCALGHGHPQVIGAIRRQSAELAHSILGGLNHPRALELADRLSRLMPTADRHVLFASDGCSAVEAALKLAIQYFANIGRPEKYRLAGMAGAYHGDSLGAMAVGFVESFHRPFRKAVAPAVQLPFPQPTDADPDGFADTENILQAHRNELAAVIVEPLCLGSAGMKMYPAGYLARLAEFCSAAEILLIVDEIAMGFGRTGRMFAFEHAGVDPDMVCLGKALTAGTMPLSACVVKDFIYRTFSDAPEDHSFYHGNTFAGHAIGCAAALSALEVYESAGFLESVSRRAAELGRRLDDLRQFPCVENIRHLGLIGALDLRPSDRPHISRLKQFLWANGYLFRPLGPTVYLLPPLIIRSEEITTAVAILEEGLKQLAATPARF